MAGSPAALAQIGAAASALRVARDHCQRPLITNHMLDLARGKIEIAALLCPQYAQELLEIRERLTLTGEDEADLTAVIGEVEAIERVLRGMTEGGE